VRAVFAPAVLSFFEGIDTKPSVEGAGRFLIFYRASKREKPEEIQSVIETGLGIFKVFVG